MASLPPSQRRPALSQRTDSEPPIPLQRSDCDVQSSVSEDSETVLLNPSSAQASRISRENVGPSAQTAPQDEVDPRRCWICFTDETEDTPTSSDWRSPCPCALTAHESCLLDWIADMDAPNSRRQRSPSEKILCPQCKSEIVLARPRSYVVNAVRALEISASKLVLPGALTMGLSSFGSLCWAYGVYSVVVVFGSEDAQQILAPIFYLAPRNLSALQRIWSIVKVRSRLDIGLALIPPILVCSRVTIADSVLPILPMLFFVTKPDTDPLLDIGSWPPSAGLSFALLPYIRSLYNTYYDRVWAEREKRWLKEIQPRVGQESSEANGQARDDIPAEDNVLEINVDLAMLDEWEGEEGDEQERAHPLNEPPMDDLGAPPEQRGVQAVAPALELEEVAPLLAQLEQAQQNRPAQAQPAPVDPAPQPEGARGAGHFNLAVSTNRLAENVLGALAFPAVSAAMGEMLRLILPKSLTTIADSRSMFSFPLSRRSTKPTGLLQTKWGRSIIGGCMFVALKDAVMLYVRWRMARDHRMRRVVDFDRRGPGRSVPPGGSR